MLWKNTSNTVAFWGEVFNHRDSCGNQVFNQLGHLTLNVLSLPYSNAEIERIFSQMNIVKSKSRSRMKTETLSEILKTSILT